MDRLGDLICTLPVDQHPKLQQANVHWLIAAGLEPVMECSHPLRLFSSMSLKFSLLNIIDLVKKLRAEQYTKVILFFAPWWVGMACWLARIPQRYSPQSRWYQILFFNHTLKQKRSRSEKHEAQYNGELLSWALDDSLSKNNNVSQLSHWQPPFLQLTSSESITLSPAPPAASAASVASAASAASVASLPNEYIVIHPGMGGSALNWPTQSYLSLTQKLVALGKNVVITGTAADQPWLAPLEGPLKSTKNVYWLVGQLNLKSLITVLSQSSATLAPSTGVLHLAASTGTKTIGIYSPIRVQTPIRWGPRGAHAKALTPDIKECPATHTCLEKACSFYPCLEQITPDQIIKELLTSSDQ